MDYLKSRLQPDIHVYASKTAGLGAYVDTSSAWLWVCLASIVFNPVFWNTVARNGESAVGGSFDASMEEVVSAVARFRRMGNARPWRLWHAISKASHSNIPKLDASPCHNLREFTTTAECARSLVEYRNKSMTKMFGGPYNGTYVLAITIFSLGIIRDLMYVSLALLKSLPLPAFSWKSLTPWVKNSYDKALLAQPVSAVLAQPVVRYAGAALFVVGQVLVVTSIWALGITGTFR